MSKKSEWLAAHNQRRHEKAVIHKPEYKVWQGIKKRIFYPSATGYEYYGGRGVGICDRWRDSFHNFYADMGPRPSPDHSIERKDTTGPYSPDNCRWATRDEQANNTRRSRFVIYNGIKKSIAQWARHLGVHKQTNRLERGMTPEQIINSFRTTSQL